MSEVQNIPQNVAGCSALIMQINYVQILDLYNICYVRN